MSTPTDLQALLASIRPRPSPGNNTPGQDPHLPQYPSAPSAPPQGLAHQQPPPYDGQSLSHPQFQQQQGYRYPSVTSIYSPSPANTPPQIDSDIISPNAPTPRGERQSQSNSDRATSLLNLLKFNQHPQAAAAVPQQQQQQQQQQAPVMPTGQPQPSSSQETGPEQASRVHARNISASDLVASLFGRQEAATAPSAATGPPTGLQQHPPERASFGEAAAPAEPAAPAAENTQDLLLNLLNRSKPSQDQSDGGPAFTSQRLPVGLTQKKPHPEETQESPSNALDAEKAIKSAQQSLSKESPFTYVNPFERLAAASLRNRTPQPKSRSASPAVGPAKGKKVNVATKVEPDATSKPSASSPASQAQYQTPQSAQQEPRETASANAGRDADHADHEANKAAKYESCAKEGTATEATAAQNAADPALSPVANQTRDTAPETKKELSEKDTAEPEKDLAKGAAANVTGETAEETAGGRPEDLVDSWENAEDKAAKEEERVVPVYNFPIRPFITITVKPNTGNIAGLRDDGVMDIARLRKDFDQLDRSLTSASPEYIVYALAKNGGMRIIRQDDGTDRQVFRSTRDRFFNVALCTSPPVTGVTAEQAALGIGVSGTVYWAMITCPERDLFELDVLENHDLTFPPFPASDENTSGGQLKTRAKPSSRHTDFFAIGRGKNIYVISPKAVSGYNMPRTARTVDTEAFFRDRALKISTGKAGKDFAFSEDDTVVVSLDKTGRLRFWDIRYVVDNLETFTTRGSTHPEIRVPLTTFVTGSPTEKSWPTSVQFIDKLRPHVKAMAIRYVLVGLKQNHTLQLWDIGLGRAVEEIRFPHENESDAICSVAYHPASGIIAVGHPTRNSIYFLHLSAPRYNLQPMSQASFVKRASERDNELPKPESTGCISGVREVSFASKGELRSLDILPISKTASDKRGVDEDNGLFELYVMHSRGVTCLNIKKEDVGWSPDNKIVRPINALEEGLIDIVDLKTLPSYVSEEPSVNGDAASTPGKAAAKEAPSKNFEVGAESNASRTVSPPKPLLKKKTGEEQAEAAANGVSEKQEKKRKRKGPTSTGESTTKVKETTTTAAASNTAAATSGEAIFDARTTPQVASKENTKEQLNGNDILTTKPENMAMPSVAKPTVVPAAGGLSKHFEDLQGSVFNEFNKSLGREFEGLSRRFNEERRAWDAATATKQDQVLRLISSTLSDNVEKNLARIVENSIRSEVVPSINHVTFDAVGKQLNEAVSKQLASVIPSELRQILPEVVTRTLQQQEMMQGLSDVVAGKLASQVQNEVSEAFHNVATPTLKDVTHRSTEKIGKDLNKQVQVQMQHYEIQRRNDSAKIDQLSTLIHGLSDTVSSMAAAQTSFQSEILRLNRLLASQKVEENNGVVGTQQQQFVAGRPIPTGEVRQQKSAEEIELAEIAQLMNEGRYEEGSVKWLQSSQQADLFDSLFVRLNPAYLTGLSPIVALSVGVAVTSSLQTNIADRLVWLEVVLQTMDLRDPDIREVAPKIMEILIQRLESLYMAIAENTPHDPILRKIPPLSRRARELHGPH